MQYVQWMKHVAPGRPGQVAANPPLASTRSSAAAAGHRRAGAAGGAARYHYRRWRSGCWRRCERNSALDYAATIGTLLGISVPNFLLAILLYCVFSIWLRWLPPIGYVKLTKDPIANLRTMLLPAVSLALPLAAVLMRNTRSAVLEVLGQEHVRVARAKGLAERRIVGRHVI